MRKFVATLLSLLLCGSSLLTPLAQASSLSPILPGPGHELNAIEENGFFSPLHLRGRMSQQESVVSNLRRREERQEHQRMQSLRKVLDNVQNVIQSKFSNQEDFQAEMERRRRASAAIFGEGGLFSYVKYADGKKVWFKGGQTAKVEGEHIKDAQGNTSTRDMWDMEYDAKGLMTSYRSNTTDANGNQQSTYWHGATYSEDSVAYGGEGTAHRKLITGYTEEATDKNGNTTVTDWRGAGYNAEGRLDHYTQTTAQPNGDVLVKEWKNGNYNDQGQLTSYDETTTDVFGLKTERKWSGGTYEKNPAYINKDETGHIPEYFLTGFHEETTDSRGQTSSRDFSNGKYDGAGNLLSYTEKTQKVVDGQTLIQNVDWANGRYDSFGHVVSYDENKTGFDGLAQTTQWRNGVYDSSGHLISFDETAIDSDGNKTVKWWTANGDQAYDQKNRLRSYSEITVDKRGNSSSRTWTAGQFGAHDRVLNYDESLVDSNGNKTDRVWSTDETGYDQRGQLLHYSESTVDETGNKTARIWENGAYNDRGQLIAFAEKNIDAYGGESTRSWTGASYDALDRVLSYDESRTDPDGNTERNLWYGAVYDDKNHLLHYQEEVTNADDETSSREWMTASDNYNSFGDLIGFQDKTTHADGTEVERVRSSSEYNLLGQVIRYVEAVIARPPFGRSNLLPQNQEIASSLENAPRNDVKIWDGGTYDSHGRLSGYAEQTTFGSGLTQTHEWQGRYDARGALVGSKEHTVDVRGISLNSTWEGWNIDNRGRATAGRQTQIWGDEPGVIVATETRDRVFDRRGKVSGGSETVTTAGTNPAGKSVYVTRVSQTSNATFNNGILTGYQELTHTRGTDPDLHWLDYSEQKIVSDISKTGTHERTTQNEHTVDTIRAEIKKDYQGRVLSYTDTVIDPNIGPAPQITRRLSTTFNEIGETTGTVDAITQPNGEHLHRTTSDLLQDNRGRVLAFREITNDGLRVEEKVRRASTYDSLGRLIYSKDELRSSEEPGTLRVSIWNGEKFDSSNRISTDRVLVKKIKNGSSQDAPDSTQETERGFITYSARGQISAYQEQTHDSENPNQDMQRQVSEITYDAWGQVASSQETRLENPPTLAGSELRGAGTIYTEIIRNQAQFDSSGRLTGYQEVSHQTSSIVDGQRIDHTQVRVRANIQYDETQKDRVRSYNDQLTDSGSPGLLTTVSHENLSFDAKDNATEFRETTRKTSADGLTNLTDIVHRFNILYSVDKQPLSYSEEHTSSDKPSTLERMNWRGTYDKKNRLFSSHEETTLLINNQVAEHIENSRTGLGYDENNQLLSYTDAHARRVRLEDGQFSTAIAQTTQRTGIHYNRLNQMVSYDEHAVRSDNSQVTDKHFEKAAYDEAGRLIRFAENTKLTADGFHVTTNNQRLDTIYDAMGRVSATTDKRFSSDKPAMTITSKTNNIHYDSQNRQTSFVQQEQQQGIKGTSFNLTKVTTRRATSHDDQGRTLGWDESMRTVGMGLDQTEHSIRSHATYNAWGEVSSYKESHQSSQSPDLLSNISYAVTSTDEFGRARATTLRTQAGDTTETQERNGIVLNQLGQITGYTESNSNSAVTQTTQSVWQGSYDEAGRLREFGERKSDDGSALTLATHRKDIRYDALGLLSSYNETSNSSAASDVVSRVDWQGYYNQSGQLSGFTQVRNSIGSTTHSEDRTVRSGISYLRNGLMKGYMESTSSSRTPDIFTVTTRNQTGYDRLGRETSFQETEQQISSPRNVSIQGPLFPWSKMDPGQKHARMTNVTYNTQNQMVGKQETSWNDAAPSLINQSLWSATYNLRGQIQTSREETHQSGVDPSGNIFDRRLVQIVGDRQYDDQDRLVSELSSSDNGQGQTKSRTWTASGFNQEGMITGDVEKIKLSGEGFSQESQTERNSLLYDANGFLNAYNETQTNSTEPEKLARRSVTNALYNGNGQLFSQKEEIFQTSRHSRMSLSGIQTFQEKVDDLDSRFRGNDDFSIHQTRTRSATDYDSKGRLLAYDETTVDHEHGTSTEVAQSNTTYNDFGLENGYEQRTHTTSLTPGILDTSSGLTHRVLNFNRLGQEISTEEAKWSSSAPNRIDNTLTTHITYNAAGQIYSYMRMNGAAGSDGLSVLQYTDQENRAATLYDEQGRAQKTTDLVRRGSSAAVTEEISKTTHYNALGQTLGLTESIHAKTEDGRVDSTTLMQTSYQYDSTGQISSLIKNSTGSSAPDLKNTETIAYVYGEAGLVLETNSVNITSSAKGEITLTTHQTSTGRDTEGRLVSYDETRASSDTPELTTRITRTGATFNALGQESGFTQREQGLSFSETTRTNATFDLAGRLRTYTDTSTDDSALTKIFAMKDTGYNSAGQMTLKHDVTINKSSDGGSYLTTLDTKQDGFSYDNQNRMTGYVEKQNSNAQGESIHHWQAKAFDGSGRVAQTKEWGQSSLEGFWRRDTNVLATDAAGRALESHSKGMSALSGDYDVVLAQTFNGLGQTAAQQETGFRHGLGNFSRGVESNFSDSYDKRGRLNHTRETLNIVGGLETATETTSQTYNNLNQVIRKESTQNGRAADAAHQERQSQSTWQGTYDNRGRAASYGIDTQTEIRDESGARIGSDHLSNGRSDIRYNDQGQTQGYTETSDHSVADQTGKEILHNQGELRRDGSQYDQDGHLTHYNEKGTKDGVPYAETYTASRFAATGEATVWSRKGTSESRGPYEDNQTNGTFDAQGRAQSYTQTGISAGTVFNKSADGIDYDAFGRVIRQHEKGETDAGGYENNQATSFDAFGRIASVRETGHDAQGAYTGNTDGFSYDMQGHVLAKDVEKTNALGERKKSHWTASGGYDGKGRLNGSFETETAWNLQGDLVSTSDKSWNRTSTFDEGFAGGLVKESETKTLTKKADGTTESTHLINKVELTDARGIATKTSDHTVTTTTGKSGSIATAEKTIDHGNITRYSADDESANSRHRAGRIAGFEETTDSHDGSAAVHSLIGGTEYDQQGNERDSDRATISSSIFGGMRDQLSAVAGSIFRFLRNLFSSVNGLLMQLLTPGAKPNAPTVSNAGGELAINLPTAVQILKPSDYTLDLAHRTNGLKDKLGRLTDWTDTSRSSTAPDKIAVSKVNAAYKSSTNEFETYDSVTTEQSLNKGGWGGRGVMKVTENHQDGFVYENGRVVSVNGHMKEQGFDPSTQENVLSREYDYTDKTPAFDAKGRATDTQRTTTNDSQSPAITRLDKTKLAYDAMGQIASREVTTTETGSDPTTGETLNRTGTNTESYGYFANGQIETTHRTSVRSDAPDLPVEETIHNRAFDDLGRTTLTETDRLTGKGDSRVSEWSKDQVTQFNANGQAAEIKHTSRKTELDLQSENTTTQNLAYDSTGRMIKNQAHNVETQTGKNKAGVSEQHTRTWDQLVQQTRFNALGQAVETVRVTSNDTGNPAVSSMREILHTATDNLGRAAQTSSQVSEKLASGRRRNYEANVINHKFDGQGRAVSSDRTTHNDSLAPDKIATVQLRDGIYNAKGDLVSNRTSSFEEGKNQDGTSYKTETQDVSHTTAYDSFHNVIDQRDLDHTALENMQKALPQLATQIQNLENGLQNLSGRISAMDGLINNFKNTDLAAMFGRAPPDTPAGWDSFIADLAGKVADQLMGLDPIVDQARREVPDFFEGIAESKENHYAEHLAQQLKEGAQSSFDASFVDYVQSNFKHELESFFLPLPNGSKIPTGSIKIKIADDGTVSLSAMQGDSLRTATVHLNAEQLAASNKTAFEAFSSVLKNQATRLVESDREFLADIDQIQSALKDAALANQAFINTSLQNISERGYSSRTFDTGYNNSNQMDSSKFEDAATGEIINQTGSIYNDRGLRTGYQETNLATGFVQDHTLGYDDYNRAVQTNTVHHEREHSYTTGKKIDSFDSNGRALRTTTSTTNDTANPGQKTTTSTRLTYDELGRLNFRENQTIIEGKGKDAEYRITNEDSDRTTSFDALGRALDFVQTTRSSAAAGLLTVKTGTNLYGKNGRLTGTRGRTSETGPGLNTSRRTIDLTTQTNELGQAKAGLQFNYADESAPAKVTLTTQNGMFYDKQGRLELRNSVTTETGRGLNRLTTSNENYTYNPNGQLEKTGFTRTDSTQPHQTVEGKTINKSWDALGRVTQTETERKTKGTNEKGNATLRTENVIETISAFNYLGQAIALDRISNSDFEGLHTNSVENVHQSFDDKGRLRRVESVNEETTTNKAGEELSRKYNTLTTNDSFNELGQVEHSIRITDEMGAQSPHVVDDSHFQYDTSGLAWDTRTHTQATNALGGKHSWTTHTIIDRRDAWGNAVSFTKIALDDSYRPAVTTTERTTNARYENGRLLSADQVVVEHGEGYGIAPFEKTRVLQKFFEYDALGHALVSEMDWTLLNEYLTQHDTSPNTDSYATQNQELQVAVDLLRQNQSTETINLETERDNQISPLKTDKTNWENRLQSWKDAIAELAPLLPEAQKLNDRIQELTGLILVASTRNPDLPAWKKEYDEATTKVKPLNDKISEALDLIKKDARNGVIPFFHNRENLTVVQKLQVLIEQYRNKPGDIQTTIDTIANDCVKKIDAVTQKYMPEIGWRENQIGLNKHKEQAEKDDREHTNSIIETIKTKGFTSQTLDATYDSQGRLTSQRDWDAVSGQETATSNYQYDEKTGTLSGFTRSYPGSETGKTEQVRLTYDINNRVVSTHTDITETIGGESHTVSNTSTIISRDSAGRASVMLNSSTDGNTSQKTSEQRTQFSYDAQSRVAATTTTMSETVDGKKTELGTKTWEAKSFDALGRAAEFKETSRMNDSPGVETLEEGKIIYGKDGLEVGRDRVVSQQGGLETTRHQVDINTKSDAAGRATESIHFTDQDSTKPGSTTLDTHHEAYKGAGLDRITIIEHTESAPGRDVHTQTITIDQKFDGAGRINNKKTTTSNDSSMPGKVTTQTQTGQTYDDYGRLTGYKEHSVSNDAEDKPEDIAMANMTYNRDGLLNTFQEVNKDVVRDVTATQYDKNGRMTEQDEKRRWGSASSKPGVVSALNLSNGVPTENGNISGLSGGWISGNVNIHNSYRYDSNGRMVGIKMTVRGNGTSGDFAGMALAGTGASTCLGAGGDLKMDFERTNIRYDSKGRMNHYDQTVSQYAKTKERYLQSSRRRDGSRKSTDRDVVGYVSSTESHDNLAFNEFGQATSNYSTFASATSIGWSRQSNITYNSKGQMSSATTESATHVYGHKYQADLHSLKDQTFTYDATGKLTETKDVRVAFDRQTVHASKSGNFFASDVGQFTRIVISTALSFVPGVGFGLSLAFSMGLSYSLGASPAQMWQTLAITVAAYYAMGGGQSGSWGTSAANNLRVAGQVFISSARTYAISKISEKIGERYGEKTALIASVVLQFTLPNTSLSTTDAHSSVHSDLNPQMRLEFDPPSLSSVRFAIVMPVELGMKLIALNNEKKSAKNNWLSATLDGLAPAISQSLGKSYGEAALEKQNPVMVEQSTERAAAHSRLHPEKNSLSDKFAKVIQTSLGKLFSGFFRKFFQSSDGFRQKSEGKITYKNSPISIFNKRDQLASSIPATSLNESSQMTKEAAVSADKALSKPVETSPEKVAEPTSPKPTVILTQEQLDKKAETTLKQMTGTDREIKVTTDENGLIAVEMNQNVWGSKDKIQVMAFKISNDGNLIEASGKLEHETPLGLITTEWNVSLGKDVYTNTKNKFDDMGVTLPGLDDLLAESFGVVKETTASGDVRQVYLGRDKDTDEMRAVASEHFDKSTKAWTLLAYGKPDKNTGEMSGQIFIRSGKDKYALSGNFTETLVDSKSFAASMSVVLSHIQSTEQVASVQKTLSSVTKVHKEFDLKGRLTREIGFTKNGQLAYALKADAGQLVVVAGETAIKLATTVADNKITAVAPMKDAVTIEDISSLTMSMPFTGQNDTAVALHAVTETQAKVKEAGVQTIKDEAANKANVVKKLENTDTLPLQQSLKKAANALAPMLKQLGFSDEQIKAGLQSLGNHLAKWVARATDSFDSIKARFVELKMAIGNFLRTHTKNETSREAATRNLTAEGKFFRVITDALRQGTIPTSFGNMLSGYLLNQLQFHTLRLSRAEGMEYSQAKQDFAMGFSQAGHLQENPSEAMILGELFGGLVPGFQQVGGYNSVRDGIKDLANGHWGWGSFKAGTGMLAMIPLVGFVGKEAGLFGKEAALIGKEASAFGKEARIAGAARIGAKATNGLPKNGLFAKVLNEDKAEQFLKGSDTLGYYKDKESFLTAFDDLKRVRTPHGFSKKLTLMDSPAGTRYRKGMNVVVIIKKSDVNELASPIEKSWSPRQWGFKPGGKTRGGAREWVVENGTIGDLEARGFKIERVYSVDTKGVKYEWKLAARKDGTYSVLQKNSPEKINVNTMNSGISLRKSHLSKEVIQSKNANDVANFGSRLKSVPVAGEMLTNSGKSLGKTPSGNFLTLNFPESKAVKVAAVGVAAAGVIGVAAGSASGEIVSSNKPTVVFKNPKAPFTGKNDTAIGKLMDKEIAAFKKEENDLDFTKMSLEKRGNEIQKKQELYWKWKADLESELISVTHDKSLIEKIRSGNWNGLARMAGQNIDTISKIIQTRWLEIDPSKAGLAMMEAVDTAASAATGKPKSFARQFTIKNLLSVMDHYEALLTRDVHQLEREKAAFGKASVYFDAARAAKAEIGKLLGDGTLSSKDRVKLNNLLGHMKMNQTVGRMLILQTRFTNRLEGADKNLWGVFNYHESNQLRERNNNLMNNGIHRILGESKGALISGKPITLAQADQLAMTTDIIQSQISGVEKAFNLAETVAYVKEAGALFVAGVSEKLDGFWAKWSTGLDTATQVIKQTLLGGKFGMEWVAGQMADLTSQLHQELAFGKGVNLLAQLVLTWGAGAVLKGLGLGLEAGRVVASQKLYAKLLYQAAGNLAEMGQLEKVYKASAGMAGAGAALSVVFEEGRALVSGKEKLLGEDAFGHAMFAHDRRLLSPSETLNVAWEGAEGGLQFVKFAPVTGMAKILSGDGIKGISYSIGEKWGIEEGSSRIWKSGLKAAEIGEEMAVALGSEKIASHAAEKGLMFAGFNPITARSIGESLGGLTGGLSMGMVGKYRGRESAFLSKAEKISTGAYDVEISKPEAVDIFVRNETGWSQKGVAVKARFAKEIWNNFSLEKFKKALRWIKSTGVKTELDSNLAIGESILFSNENGFKNLAGKLELRSNNALQHENRLHKKQVGWENLLIERKEKLKLTEENANGIFRQVVWEKGNTAGTVHGKEPSFDAGRKGSVDQGIGRGDETGRYRDSGDEGRPRKNDTRIGQHDGLDRAQRQSDGRVDNPRKKISRFIERGAESERKSGRREEESGRFQGEIDLLAAKIRRAESIRSKLRERADRNRSGAEEARSLGERAGLLRLDLKEKRNIIRNSIAEDSAHGLKDSPIEVALSNQPAFHPSLYPSGFMGKLWKAFDLVTVRINSSIGIISPQKNECGIVSMVTGQKNIPYSAPYVGAALGADYVVVKQMSGKFFDKTTFTVIDIGRKPASLSLSQLGGGEGTGRVVTYSTIQDAAQSIQLHSGIRGKTVLPAEAIIKGMENATPLLPFYVRSYIVKKTALFLPQIVKDLFSDKEKYIFR